MLGKVITIVGIPAVGKTYLTKRLAEHYRAVPVYEVPDELPNGNLPPEIVESLATQTNLFRTFIWFRNLEVSNHLRALNEAKKGNMVVLDTPFYQSQLFTDTYLRDSFEKSIITEMGRIDFDAYPHTDCTVYIRTDRKMMEDFLDRRSSLGREWERSAVWRNTILDIAEHGTHFMDSIKHSIPNLIEIDRSDFDFERDEDLRQIIDRIDRALRTGSIDSA